MRGDGQCTRRQVLGVVAAGAAAALPACGADAATSAERLDESEPTARALAYTHDAEGVDAATRGGAGRRCAGCRFYTAPGSDWGPCQLFPGRAVKASGWCTAWAAPA